MGFKEILTKTKVCCLDCSVSLLLFSNIWKFIYLAELSIQKNPKQTKNKKKKGKKKNQQKTKQKKPPSAQVDRTSLFSSVCACYLGREKIKK